jgi:peptidoglycan/LPS O-acetylase OafA/YrhL
MAAVALGWLSWANWKWLTFAGALTYPFYLIHEHLGWFGIRIYHRYLGLGAYPTLFATVLTMLVLAYLMNKFVEKPFGPRLKRALKISEERKALVRGGA